jgi:hypothetical protein
MPLVVNPDLSIGESTIEKLKTAETTTPTPPTTAQSDTKLSSQAGAPVPTTPVQTGTQDFYYTQKVGNTGLTQAQLDARGNALATARLVGGTTVANPAGGLTVTRSVAPGPVSAGGGTDGSTATTNLDILKANLRGLGFTSAIIDSSASFLQSLLKEGLDYDNATEIFLNNKEFTLKSGTKLTSPFYTEYGFLNEGLVVPKSANELFNAVEGYKEIIDKYSLSKKYLEKDSLKNYVKNNVTTKDLAERANIATLKSVNQDPAYVEALQRLGFISTAADLKDFFMDSKIGQEQLNINRTTGAFAAEAIRRAQSGIEFNSERFRAISQTMVEKGISEQGAATLAAQGFENIAAQLGTTTKLSGMYEASRAGTASQIQTELEREEFGGLESERRKRLKTQEEAAFQGSSGRIGGRQSTAGII